jgi:hypothetical protein
MMKLARLTMTGVLALSALVISIAPTIALAQSTTAAARPDATATFTTTSIAVGVGYSWGTGVLRYRGRNYPFKVGGLSALGLGASSVQGTAEIYNLGQISDFDGLYGAASASATAGTEGVGTGILRNTDGVELRLNTHSEGLQLNLAISGVTIELEPY